MRGFQGFKHFLIFNREYIEEMSTYKIIVIGDQNSGKTSIVNRYSLGTFNSNVQNTIGVEFTHKILDDETKISIWDTAGQERFRSVTGSFYRNSEVVVFVYDINSRETFLNLGQWWREYITYGEKDSILFLVGNKIDLERHVTEEEAKAWAARNGMSYVETSALDGNGVNQLFDKIVGKLNELPKVYKEKIELRQRPKSDRCCF